MYFHHLETIEEDVEYTYNENISKNKILYRIHRRLNKYKTYRSKEEEYYIKKIEKMKKKEKRINKFKKMVGILLCPCLCISYCCVSVICDIPMNCCIRNTE